MAGGVPHDFVGNMTYTNLEGAQEKIFIGPAAGQMAIKHFVVNGGSIFTSAGAHSFEAPSRMVIMIGLFLIVITPISLILFEFQ